VAWKGNAAKGTPASVYGDSVLDVEDVEFDAAKAACEMATYVDVSDSGPSPLKYGGETLVVNSSIMSVS